MFEYMGTCMCIVFWLFGLRPAVLCGAQVWMRLKLAFGLRVFLLTLA